MDVTMTEITLPAGTSNISYSVTANGVNDIIRLNNQTQSVTSIKAGLPVDELSKGFESSVVGFQPTDMLLDMPLGVFLVDGAILQSPETLGGFGESDVSMRINFYQWDPSNFVSTGSVAIADQLTVETNFAALDFDYAFTTYTGSQDKMEVQVSTDCGSTFTTLWEKSGSDLATAPELNNPQGAFVPNATQWVTESVDISDYVGETILVRFFFTTGWGDMMYIDNINAKGVSNTESLELANEISLYPNPANTIANIELNLENSSTVVADVLDNLGRKVLTQNFGDVQGANTLRLDVSNLNTGAYFLQLRVDDLLVIKKLSVK